MKLTTEKFEIETNSMGQVSSINFEGTELLHDGKNWWKKTFPIIWPVIGISQGFEYEGKNYVIPKHGFMKDLDWDGYVIDNKITMMATFIKNDVYPFSMDVQVNVWAEGNTVFIETSFANISKKEAYFHFGYHPAFRIDETSIIKSPDTLAFDFEGKLMKTPIKQDVLVKMPFGIEYDTIINKNVDFNKVEYNYKDLKIEVLFDSPNVQYWKPTDAMFVCIEPWWGAGDEESDIVPIAKEKDGIIKLASGNTWKGSMAIKVK